MAEVRLEQIGKRVGAQTILDDVSLTIRDGEFFALVGPSGSGKSTLLHLMAGLDTPTVGRIVFDGVDVTAAEPRERDIALVFQSYALYPHLTVFENLAFPLRVGRKRDPASVTADVERVAAMLGLDALLHRRPRELSGGQRQRVALGRALIRQPRVFLLDEPLSNLDVQLRAGMRAELRRLHDQLGITTIYVTHDQTEAMTLADRIAVLDHGRIQQIGAPDALYTQPRNAMVAAFIGHPPMNLWEAWVEAGTAITGPVRLPAAGAAGLIRVGVRPEDLRIARAAPLDARAAGGTARLIEPSGGQTWVTADVPGGRGSGMLTLTGLGDDGNLPRPGEPVSVSLIRPRAHCFDVRTGERLAPDRPVTMAHGA